MTEIRYGDTVQAVFLERLNRFTAEVTLDGAVERVHVLNTGRLRELLIPGAAATLLRARAPGRKTAWDLVSVWKEGLGWVNVDSLAPNRLMLLYAREHYDLVRPEYRFGQSRIDLYMEKQGQRFLTEVKGCTLAGGDGVGLFPDAPTERGIKHLRELASAAARGYIGTIAFVIQMNGIDRVIPNRAAHPAFEEALRAAVRAGVRVQQVRCRVGPDTLTLLDVADDTGRWAPLMECRD